MIGVAGLGLVATLAGCAKEPPDLLADLDGDWVGAVVLDDERDAAAAFTWDEDAQALAGSFTVQDPDEERVYDVLEAESIEELGVAVTMIQRNGVRKLYLAALVPLDPIDAAYRTEWYCPEEADLFCGDEGGLHLDRVGP